MSAGTEELSTTVNAALKNLLKEKGISNYGCEVLPASSAGENCYGEVLRIKITPKNDQSLATSFVVKSSPKNEARRKQMKVVQYYTREVFMYENVLSEYLNIQNECNIDKQKMFNGFPHMYYSSLADHDEFILFEDLQESKYYRFDRRKPLTFEHTATAIKELAKFHSMSFVLKEKKPKTFQKFIAQIRYDNLFSEDIETLSVEFAKAYINKALKIIENNSPNKENIIDFVKHIRDNFKKICIDLVDGRKAEPYAVICHGDFWNNNILYKYDENQLPVSAKILDFQVSRYSSPVLDIMHYLFVCTEKKLRDEHYDELKRIYHQTLSDHLKLFDLDPEKIFSYKAFEDQLSVFGAYGFCISILAIPFVISDSKDIPDLDEVAEANDAVNANTTHQDEHEAATQSIIDEYELLTEITYPIFRRRILGITNDMENNNMLRTFY